MSQITIGGTTLNFKDSAFTGDQWEQVASWVLNGGAEGIDANAKIATEKAAAASTSAAAARNSAISAGESAIAAETAKQDAESAATEAQNAATAMQECAPYSSTKSYVVGNMVTSGGSTYRCIVKCTGAAPPNNTYWLVIAQKGADGMVQKSSIVTATLLPTGWTGDAAPYSYALTVSGVTATSNQEVLPALNITAEQLEALQSANIQDGGQAANTMTLKAYGDKPTIDLPIRVIKRGD